MKESEKEEARKWLGELLEIHEQCETAIREVSNLSTESSAED